MAEPVSPTAHCVRPRIVSILYLKGRVRVTLKKDYKISRLCRGCRTAA
jgi:hypothetical protein